MKTEYIRLLHLYGEKLGNGVAGTTADITVLERDFQGKISRATGLDVPVNATAGYAKGCLFIDRNVVTGSSGLYENIGTTTSCVFNAIGAITADEITLAQGSVLIGNASGAATALDGKTTTQILVGNGTTMTSVALSQDITMNNAGVVTIAKINNLATAAEVNRACDVSTRKVALTGTAAITEVLHEGKTCVITGTGAEYTYTLPEATGSGAKYTFIMNEVNTSNTIFTTADAGNCSFFGSVNILDKDAAAQAAYAPAATDEIMTLNGTSTGGAVGDFIQFIDMATDKWMVFAQMQCPTGSNPATPFSGA